MSLLTADFLANLSIFQGTTEAERGQILQNMIRRRYAPKQDIAVSGQTLRELSVILEGSAEVMLEVYGFENPLVGREEGRAPLVESSKIAQLDVGAVFGELSFFAGGPHSATIRALTPVELLCLPYDAFMEMVRHESHASYKIALNGARIVAERLRSTDRLIGDLILGQHDAAARSRWFEEHLRLHGVSTPVGSVGEE